MFELSDIKPLGRTFLGLPMFDAGDGEQWAVGDETQVTTAVGKAVIDALKKTSPENADGLVSILGRQATDLVRAAAKPGGREFGLFLYRLR